MLNNGRGLKAIKKIKRVRDTIYYENPDTFPVADLFFWDEFVTSWKNYFKLEKEVDIFSYYDLDIVVCSPNIDPIINNVVEIEKTENYMIYKGGFGSVLKLNFTQPIPYFIDYVLKDIKDLVNFEFENPLDERRFNDYFAVTDQFYKSISFNEQLGRYKNDFCILGNICEARETIWRIVGLENELIAIKEFPEILLKFGLRAADFNIELGKAQLENENIDGLIVYGDIGYSGGLFMDRNSWRNVYLPPLKKICQVLKKYNKPLIYHTDGNYLEIMDDLVEIGFNATHPNEAKTGIDVVKLIEKYKNKIAFFGNIDAANALSIDRPSINKEINYKLRAISETGGYIPGGDDVPASVTPENYDYYINYLKNVQNSLKIQDEYKN